MSFSSFKSFGNQVAIPKLFENLLNKYRYFRWSIDATHGDGFQAGEFDLKKGDTKLSKTDIIITADKGTKYREGAPNLGDNNFNTKCFSDQIPIIFTFDYGRNVDFDGYSYTTGNDTASYPNRNPKSFTLSASLDNSNYVLLSTIINSESTVANYTEVSFIL
jgi:hypothetical protein